MINLDKDLNNMSDDLDILNALDEIHLHSSASLIKRISVDADDNFGIEPAYEIPGDTTAFVAFGGGGTKDSHMANYYASLLKHLFANNGIDGVDVYSAFYDKQDQDSRLTRLNEFRMAGHRVRQMIKPAEETHIADMHASEPTPRYIKQLYNMVLRPRVFDDAGRPLPIDVVLTRVRKLKFFTHCHGSMIVYMMGKIMRREMRNAGYTSAQIRQIMGQLLVVQYAPANPLEKNDFNVISFASSNDNMMGEHNNKFSDFVMKNASDFPPAFIGGARGNVFFAPRLHEGMGNEHALSFEEWRRPYLTENGNLIYDLMRRALVSGAKHSLTGGALWNTAKLTTENRREFNKLKDAGDEIYKNMLQTLRRRDK